MSSLPPRSRQRAAIAANAPGSVLGLYPGTDFVVGDGAGTDGVTFRQIRWYFQHETVALPRPGVATVTLAGGLDAMAELGAWLSRARGAPEPYPPVVWVAAPHVIGHGRIDADATHLLAADGTWNVSLVPRLPLNKSYFNEITAAWFHQRPVRVRGTLAADSLLIRTLWPKDFRLPRDARRAEVQQPPTTVEGIRALVRAEPNGGAASPFSASLLWSRDGASYGVPAGRAIVAIIVNGAQGDDDEAHGGHFALLTGRTAADGSIAEWMVNNFYSLDIESEKGIIAAPVPLDNYLADLNSGQGYYRPSAMLVAVLAEDRAATLLQSALNRVYAQFYRHQIVYDHAAMNCAGISVDVLRKLGFPVPARGPAAPVRAALGLPWLIAREGSVRKACAVFDYLTEDQTRLLPAAAFEEIGAGLVALACRSMAAETGSLARTFADDVEALFFLRFPQFPTPRALGHAPVLTPFEFHERQPADPADAQIIPVPPRPFPRELRDEDLLPPPTPRSERALRAWGAASIVGLPWALWRIWRGARTVND